jgi:hypothetical protein
MGVEKGGEEGGHTGCLMPDFFLNPMMTKLQVEFGEDAHAQGVDGGVCHVLLLVPLYFWARNG